MNNEKEQVKFSRFQDFLRKFKRQKTAIGALFIIFCLVLIAISPLVMWLATSLTRDLTETARSYLRSILWMCSYYMIGRTLNTMLINGIFSAGGDTRFGFWCDLANLWGLIIPAAWIAALLTDFANPLLVYFILYLDEFTKIPIEYMHYKKYRWLRNITSDAGDEGVPAGADPGR